MDSKTEDIGTCHKVYSTVHMHKIYCKNMHIFIKMLGRNNG